MLPPGHKDHIGASRGQDAAEITTGTIDTFYRKFHDISPLQIGPIAKRSRQEAMPEDDPAWALGNRQRPSSQRCSTPSCPQVQTSSVLFTSTVCTGQGPK